MEEAERDARTKEKDVEGARRALEHEKQKLEMQRDRRQEVEAQLREAVQQAYLHKELARLLGRDSLQRHLLHRAETRIVRNANEVLDRISGGRLRLELRTNDDPGGRKQAKGKPKSQAKALDLVAFNSDTGTKAIPVSFLSGSQRFRVAVSLALGIGQFTDHGARRVESVIIDEGFGGLDKEGRREVIDELHLLKDILRRIILVSHQEEFAAAFANGYEIRLENGMSKVKLLTG